ncbi:hypothetical protein V9T40_002844 [Parthenolecanium corni]|uniref:Major facilitator superfamily (MFS) profile domain-containing protein n=1 Tax=Parthenolecanium corni TaxID=536013 RepID=A0AAN9TXK8_9HEMI
MMAGKRYFISMLICLGTCILITLQLNLTITIVQMTKGYNITVGNETKQVAEFKWDSVTQGLILSISGYGILFSPLGGLLARRFGGATVFGSGLGFSALLTLMTPFSVRQHIAFFVICRLMEGISQGIIGASLMEVFVRWTPPEERSRLIVNGINGYYLGAAISHPISGYVAQHYGWEAVFFVTGGIALTWYLIWVLLVTNEPAEDRFITAAEKAYLMENVPPVSKVKISYPWKKILTSKPVWALLNEFFTLAWSFSFVAHNLPVYINDVQNRDIESIGLIASLPNLCSLIGSAVAAFINDFLRTRQILRVQTIYKSFVSFGQISAVILLVITALFMGFEGSIICFSLFRFCFSFAETSYEVLPADLAAPYASLIRGMSITTMAIGFILSPTIMGLMTADHSRASWNRFFLLLSCFNVWSLVMFLLFGSAEPQPWAKQPATIRQSKSRDWSNSCELDSRIAAEMST